MLLYVFKWSLPSSHIFPSKVPQPETFYEHLAQFVYFRFLGVLCLLLYAAGRAQGLHAWRSFTGCPSPPFPSSFGKIQPMWWDVETSGWVLVRCTQSDLYIFGYCYNRLLTLDTGNLDLSRTDSYFTHHSLAFRLYSALVYVTSKPLTLSDLLEHQSNFLALLWQLVAALFWRMMLILIQELIFVFTITLEHFHIKTERCVS